MDSEEARVALDSVERIDREMAEQMTWPLWRHAAFGAIEALFLLGWGLNTAGMALCFVVALVGLGWIVHDDRQRYGVFISGYSSRAARPAIWLALFIFLAGLAAIMLTGELHVWTPWVPAVVAIVFVGETLASIWWQKLFHADLQRSGSLS